MKTMLTGLSYRLAPGEYFLDFTDYTVNGDYITINDNALCGTHSTNLTVYTIRKRVVAFADDKAPPIKECKWPVPPGRYILMGIVIDVMFPRSGVEDYLDDGDGIWKHWKYNLRCGIVVDLAMDILSMWKGKTVNNFMRYMMDLLNRNILKGAWNDDMTDGKHPSYWCSTEHILSEFDRTKTQVKYAQCWVFSEVMVSLLRVLNIPSRSLFILNARVDRGRDRGVDIGLHKKKGLLSENELNISEFMTELHLSEPYTQKGQASSRSKAFDIKRIILEDDSVWNFHVMVEAYNSRWVCLDPSPIIPSTYGDEYLGKYTLGPCDVDGIKISTPDNLSEMCDHQYFYDAFNATFRVWNTSKLKGVEITYPKAIYNAVGGRETRVFANDNSGERAEVTDRYKCVNPPGKCNNPLVFNYYNLVVNTRMGRRLLLQVCYLTPDGKLTECDREIITVCDDIPVKQISNGSISILIIDPATKEWWCQVVEVESSYV